MRQKMQHFTFCNNRACACYSAIIEPPAGVAAQIDRILQESDSTLAFVEVRKRTQRQFGGALGSVSRAKQRRIVFACALTFCGAGSTLPPDPI
jgi:hypothetical protein